MPTQQLYTYKDAVDNALDFLGADAQVQARQAARKAVSTALDQLCREHPWTYFYARGRLATVAPYSTGTLAYDHTGGTYERQVTLTDGAFPSWATYGFIAISNVVYEVAERISSTIVTLTAHNNPGDDIASGTSYTLFRDSYPLPVDFLSCDRFLNASNAGYLHFSHPREWLERQRINITTAQPRMWTLTGDPNYAGLLCVRFYPAPDAAYQMDFLYQRRARPLVIEEEKTGTVTVSNGSATVSGTGTSFSQRHVGAVLRFGDTQNTPTGLRGNYPYTYERVIMSVESTTSLTVDAVLPEAIAAVKYSLSDPIDIENGAMLAAFERGVEKEIAFSKRMKDRLDAAQHYQATLRLAMQADSRVSERRAAGAYPSYRTRLADMPTGDDLG